MMKCVGESYVLTSLYLSAIPCAGVCYNAGEEILYCALILHPDVSIILTFS